MADSRKRRFKLNTASGIVNQLVSVICGFILPRVILQYFGSEVNGLVSSINQFLFIIQFLELGVGAATASALYYPLAVKDKNGVDAVVSSATSFFGKIGTILIFYVAILTAFYPKFVNSAFDYLYIASLILILSVNYFSQYYIGIVDNLLIGADQRSYIQYSVQIISQILNTFVCVILMHLGYGIHAVKLSTAVIYLFRPIVVRIYVKRKYNPNRHLHYDKEPIPQKWNAVAQHISECILDSTDTIILTLFSSLSNVSIYSVYNSVAFGLKQFFMASTNGTQSLLGELWAKGEKDELNKIYVWNEWTTHTVVVFVFSCAGYLVAPFAKIYTNNINDANYVQPVFGFLLCMAHASHCLRLPYFTLIKAAGKYKQTQNNFIIASIMNIVISIALVGKLGLSGVAIGTLVSMTFQTIWMANYCSKNLMNIGIKGFLKQSIVDITSVAIIILIASVFRLKNVTISSWVIEAVEVSVVALIVMFGMNYIFYKNFIKNIMAKIKKIIKMR